MKLSAYLFFAGILLSAGTAAQTVLVADTSVVVTEAGAPLPKAWTGGLDCPMYSTIDLNNDGIKDLFVFDHKTDRILTFINNNQSTISYRFAPEYASYFPDLHDWVKLYDYDCDGYEDIFTHGNGSIACYHNNGTTPLSFTFITPMMMSYYHFGSTFFLTNIYVSAVNVPTFADLDSDGDMDVLSFPLGASYVEYHKNYSMDSTGLCGGFRFYNIRQCWGYFTLNANANRATLPPATISGGLCPAYPASYPRPASAASSILDTLRHAGNILEAIDMNADGDKDLLIGDIVGRTLLYLENGGNADSAYVVAQDTLFPSYNVPAVLDFVAAPYINDLDNDGKKDLLVANFNGDLFQGAGENYYTTMLYSNVSPQLNGYQFQYIKNSFFNEEMIDVGTGAHPAFLDVDADGKTDMIIGSDFHYYTGGTRKAQLTYYRNTSTAQTPSFELITRDYLGLSTYSFSGLYPAFGDIDGDGDADMILGNTDATITLFRNVAGAGNPVNFILDSMNYQGISVGSNGQQSIPQLYDLDKDGKLDLILGRRVGRLSFYQNTGTSTSPVFTFITDTLGGVDVHDPYTLLGYSTPLFYDSAGTTQLLVGSYTGQIYQYTNIDGNLHGTFTLVDPNYSDISEPLSAAPAMIDINSDGLMDLIVGNTAGGLRCFTRQTVGIGEQLPDPSFDFYPNPASGSVTIEFDNASEREVKIIDVLGNTVMHRTVNNKTALISTAGLSSGYYILTVMHQGKTVSRKFIKR